MEKFNAVTVHVAAGDTNTPVTFHPTNNAFAPLPGLDKDLEWKIKQAQLRLLPYEGILLQWLAAAPENGQQYCQDPIAALEAAGLGIPADVLEEIKAASALLVNTLKP